MPATMQKLSLDQARAAWVRAQGLDAAQAGPIEDVIAKTGWLRTLAGADVYLAARARVPGLKRATLDEAVAASRLQVIPAVRGCMYLVPRAHVPLALAIAGDLSRPRFRRDYEKAGVDPREIEALGQAVVAALAAGPLTTDALKKALPTGAARSLGEAGKKIGMSSTLPSALREAELAGQIERTLEGGRLDSDRYLWRVPTRNPFDGADVPDEPTARHARLLEIFLHAAGPATLKHFADWAGLAQKDAKAAAARLELVSVSIEGFAADAVALPSLDPTPVDALAMLSLEDNLIALHGGPAPFLDPRHHDREVPLWGPGKSNKLGVARHIEVRTILVGDRLAGMWEYDAAAGDLAIAALDPLPAGVQALAKDTAAFLRDELGHGRSFGLDTDKDVAARAAFMRSL